MLRRAIVFPACWLLACWKYNRLRKHKFVMGLADLIAIPNISARLKAPEKVGDKVLGSKPDAWCEFH